MVIYLWVNSRPELDVYIHWQSTGIRDGPVNFCKSNIHRATHIETRALTPWLANNRKIAYYTFFLLLF